MTKKIATQANLSEDSALLKVVLADTFVLYMKTYAVHWNYKGSKFFSVHRLTEEHYQALADAIDEIAERIRAKGDEAPFSLSDIMGSADLKEIKETDVGTDQAIKDLVRSHEILSQKAHEAADALNEHKDVYSADMMIKRVGEHDKAAWMLKSFLQQ